MHWRGIYSNQPIVFLVITSYIDYVICIECITEVFISMFYSFEAGTADSGICEWSS